MIDLHCHILPGVDDGPPGLEGSVALARALLQDGVRTVAATPHRGWGTYSGDGADVGRRIGLLRSELVRLGLELELLPGLELYLTPETPALHARGEILTLNASRYLLVEFPPHMVPPYAEEALFQLQLQRLVPVIAHPERNAEIAANPEILQRMVNRGMLAQLTAGSLVGSFGTRTREAAELMLARGIVQIIASDAHSAGDRSPSLSAAIGRAVELAGEDMARAMVTAIPWAILHDEEIASPEPQPAPRRSWFPFRQK